MRFSDLDLNKTYTYADYFKWKFDERVELIKGKVFKMSPAPNTWHQVITGEMFVKLRTFLEKNPCSVFIAPFDVRFIRKSKDDHDITTVLQPDICVVCDRSKIDYRGCVGAPDLVVEVLSPGNNAKELKKKYEVYEESGVIEYWVISPQDQWLQIHTLTNGKFKQSPYYVSGDTVTSSVLPGFSLDLTGIFKEIVSEDCPEPYTDTTPGAPAR